MPRSDGLSPTRMLRDRLAAIAATIVVMSTGCPRDEAPPKKVDRAVDTKKIPVPNHSPAVMNDPGEPRRVGVNGTMEASVSGKTQKFTFFPRGLNAAAANPETGAAWVKVRGALDSESEPYLELTIDRLNLGTAKLPLTVTADADQNEPRLRATFRIDPVNYWNSPEEGEDAARTKVVLQSFDGKTLTGTFEGVLESHASADPIELTDGTFTIEPRLNGIEAAKPDSAADVAVKEADPSEAPKP